MAVGARTFFWTPGNKIKVVGRSADGLYEVADLSHRLGNGIDLTMQYALNANQSTMFGVYSPKENIVKWFCRSAAGTYNDMAIIYDIEHDTWLVDTYNQTIFVAGAQDSKNLYIAGRSGGSLPTTAPKIYKDATGALDDIADYDMLLYTKRWMFGDPTLQKQFWGGRLFMDMKTGSTIDMEIWVDGAKVYEATLSAANGDTTPGNRPLDTNTVELCYTITK